MTKYEKRSLRRFLSVYALSLTLLASLVAFLVYKNEQTLLYDQYRYRMQSYAATLSSAIVTAHMMDPAPMQNRQTLLQRLPHNDAFGYALYDKKHQKISGEFELLFDPAVPFFERNKQLYWIDSGALLHLGVTYIVVRDIHFYEALTELRQSILLYLGLSLGIILLIGAYLGQLFLAPVREQIKKLDTFIKDTTHELNTPVSALLMSVNSLKKLAVDPKVTRRIDISAKRIGAIYDDLTYLFFRDLEKREAKPVAFERLVAERVEYFGDLAAMKQVSFHVKTEPFVYTIDEESAVRLLDNLISNAVKYNRPGGRVTITLKEGTLRVEDNGIGMDQKSLGTIFGRYVRAKSAKGGFGVGLHIVASICEENNIAVDVSSQPDKGTVFTLSF